MLHDFRIPIGATTQLPLRVSLIPQPTGTTPSGTTTARATAARQKQKQRSEDGHSQSGGETTYFLKRDVFHRAKSQTLLLLQVRWGLDLGLLRHSGVCQPDADGGNTQDGTAKPKG